MGQIRVSLRVHNFPHLFYNFLLPILQILCVNPRQKGSSQRILRLKSSEGLTVEEEKFFLLLTMSFIYLRLLIIYKKLNCQKKFKVKID